ncbi:hypothetical protein [Enterobacter sp. CP102]|uniref:hypothetical protein n=1 Tax=Enterobacter sp. CP102 TaxID=2976431 RepID=UPI002206006A|nr:hypothetical protein [Enterobacter sp. CP102]UWM63530.1 hypothetical protein N1249_18615 [Enterobacter sp. CP102]
MSESGFDDDDLSLTLARFVGKRRNLVCDESKLKWKKPEPIALTSATNSLGISVLNSVASAVSKAQKNYDDTEFRKNRPWLWYSWERKEDFK